MTKSHYVAIVCIFIGGTFCLLPIVFYLLSSGQVRSSSYINSAFNYSRNGNQLVFTDDGDGGSDLFVLNLQSSTIRCVAKTPAYEGEPSFSPNGKWIVYSAAVPGEDADYIFVRSTDGKQVKQLTNERLNDKDPVFSPDGLRVVFARNHQITGGMQAPTWSGFCSLYMINVDGTQLKRLSDSYYDITHPQFTPDGAAVIFNATPEFSESDLRNRTSGMPTSNVFVIAVASGRMEGIPQQLTQDGDIGYVSISPDGDRLVTQSNSGRICIRKRGGTVLRDLGKKITADLTGYAAKPAFTPDGEHIAFLLRSYNNRSTLWHINLLGANATGVMDEVLFSDPLNWRAYRL